MYTELEETISKDKIKYDEPLSKHTSFNIGGPADVMVFVSNEEELRKVLETVKKEKYDFFLLGNGSNVLASDDGFRGVIIKLGGDFLNVSVEKDTITAGAGVTLTKLANAAMNASLSGLEFASGIPGTLGGALFMNAGAYGGEICQCLKDAEILFLDGSTEHCSAEDLKLSYRYSCLKDRPGCVIKAVFTLNEDDPEMIRGRMEEYKKKRLEKQPLEYPSAGSTFKRPEGFFAGKLISDAGLSGEHVGDAYVSEKHCGFIVNKGNATATDIHQLMVRVQSRVKEYTGVTLEPEVIMLGEF